MGVSGRRTRSAKQKAPSRRRRANAPFSQRSSLNRSLKKKSPSRSSPKTAVPAEEVAKALLPHLSDLCQHWRALWVRHIEPLEPTNGRRLATWIGHITLRELLSCLARDQHDKSLDLVAQSTRLLWQFDVYPNDLSRMISFYEATANTWIPRVIHEKRLISQAIRAFDGFFHDVFSTTFDVYSRLDRSRVRRPSGLTKREEQVLIGIAEGATSREIGTRLQLSPRTVEAVRTRLKTKLGLKDTAELVRYAFKTRGGW